MPDPETQVAPPGDHPKRKSILGIIFLTLFIDLVGFSIIFPLFPAMLDFYLARETSSGGGWASRLIEWLYQVTGDSGNLFLVTVLFGGILGSLYSVLQYIFSPLWGAFSDRHGRRNTLLITTAGICVSYLIWAVSASFEWLILSRLLGGMMAGNISVASAAVADISDRKKRSSGLAIVGVAFGLGFILGPAIGGIASNWVPPNLAPPEQTFGLHPFSIPALLAGGLALLNCIWVALRFPETLSEKRRAIAKASPRPRYSPLSLLERSIIGQTNRIYFLLILAFSGMEFTLTFFAVERFQYTPMNNGLMFVFIGVSLALIQGGLVRRLAPKLGELPLIKFGLISGIFAFCLIGFTGNHQFLFYLGLLAMACCIGFTSPTLQGLVSLYSSDEEQGQNLGLQRSAGALARAFGPFLGALIYFNLGASVAYLVCAVVLLIPTALALRLPKPERS